MLGPHHRMISCGNGCGLLGRVSVRDSTPGGKPLLHDDDRDARSLIDPRKIKVSPWQSSQAVKEDESDLGIVTRLLNVRDYRLGDFTLLRVEAELHEPFKPVSSSIDGADKPFSFSGEAPSGTQRQNSRLGFHLIHD